MRQSVVLVVRCAMVLVGFLVASLFLVLPDGVAAPIVPAGSLAAGASVARAHASAALRLEVPGNLVVTADGTLDVADLGLDEIVALAPNGALRVVAGDGEKGNSGDEGPAVRARITDPTSLVSGADGTLCFVSDGLVRCVSGSGTISTVAGGGSATPADGEPARSVALRLGVGLARAPDGVLDLAPRGADEVFALVGGRLHEIVTPGDLLGVDPVFPDDRDLATSALGVDPEGDLFLSTDDPYAVIVRTSSGAMRYVGVGRAQQTEPFATTSTALYVAVNYGIERFAPDVPTEPGTAAPVDQFVTDGLRGLLPENQFLDPAGIAVERSGDVVTDGDLYGAPNDADGDHAAVVVLSPAGKVISLRQWG